MVEPDPDRRAISVAAALDWTAPSPPSAPAPLVPVAAATSEDAAVKSVRKLLWLLWGLGWVIVPLLVRRLGMPKDTIPLAMFGMLACLFVVTWHKGAVIRAIMRAVAGEAQRAQALGKPAPAAERGSRAGSTPRHRVDVGEAGKVRVHAGEPGEPHELGDGELLGQTELSTHEDRPARSAERPRGP